MITIVVTHEDDQSDEFDFDPSQSTISIGRRSTNDVCIPNLSVSGRHARIVFNDGEAWVEDMKSTNGTYINNRLISRQMLNHEDELIIGKTRVRYQNAAAGKTVDVEPESLDDEFDSADPFDDSLQVENETAMETVTETPAPVAKAAAAPVATAAVAKASSSEALFESLADDLSDRGPSNADIAPAIDDEEPMTLSQKAKLALGRPEAKRPTLSAVNGGAAMQNLTYHCLSQNLKQRVPLLLKPTVL